MRVYHTTAILLITRASRVILEKTKAQETVDSGGLEPPKPLQGAPDLLEPIRWNLGGPSCPKVLKYHHTGKGRGTYAFLSGLSGEFLKRVFVKSYSKSLL